VSGRIRIVAQAGVTALFLVTPAVAGATAPEERLLEEVDEIRRAHGLPALRDSEALSRSAARHSRFMLAHDRFGHAGSIRAEGHWSAVGENLAMRWGWTSSVGWVLRGWMRSSKHRAVLLSPRFRYAGAGYARGRLGRSRSTMWTLHCGRR
jgi:uncharacterized protein YkwD